MISVGLTGNVGCGKSTVARLFEAHGAEIHDADACVHELLGQGGGAVDAVLAAFPEVAAAGPSVDRPRLASIVFADAARRRELERIVHPLVLERSRALLAGAAARGVPLVVTEAALLFEAADAGHAPGSLERFDAIVVVTCDEELQLRRLIARSQLPPAEAEADARRRRAAQAPQSEKARRATHVIDNSGSLEETARQVAMVHSALLAAGGRRPVSTRSGASAHAAPPQSAAQTAPHTAQATPPARPPTPHTRPRVLGPDSVQRRVLPNGLTILVLPDPSVPSIAYTTHYRVGSRNERPGITGISHLFEHMMFNGAKKHGAGRFDKIIESNGGMNNAYTTQDVTVYYEVMPAEALHVVLDLELDRMRDLDLTERNLESEREVVKEERRMRTDDSPIGALHELFQATAYLAHPYRWPVIGWMPDIDAISVADIQDYFRIHYTPGNTIVVVAGDVEGERALDEIGAVLSVLESGPPQPPVVRSEPPQRGERRAVLKREAQLPSLLVGWQACDAASPDLPVLDVLQAALIDGDTGRLRKRLVLGDELAIDVHADFPWMMDPGLFTIGATPKPGVEPARVEAVILEELQRLAREPLEERELRKVKNQLKADFFRRLKTNEGRADLIGGSEILFGSHAAIFALPDRYEAVDAESVREAAARLLQPDQRTVAQLIPLAGGAPGHDAPADHAQGDEHE